MNSAANEPRVRAATLADLDAVVAIAKSSPESARWSRAELEKEIGSPRSLFLVADDGSVRGYGLLWIVDDAAQIHDIAVAPDHRRRGVGRSLLNSLIAGARARRCAKAALEVSHTNAAAQALYQAAGFFVVGRRAKFYNDGSDAVLMDLKI